MSNNSIYLKQQGMTPDKNTINQESDGNRFFAILLIDWSESFIDQGSWLVFPMFSNQLSFLSTLST